MTDKDILCELYMDTFSDVSYDGETEILMVTVTSQQ
jgi:hypothetical protein